MGGVFGAMMMRHANHISGRSWLVEPATRVPAKKRKAKHHASKDQLLAIQRTYTEARQAAFMQFHDAVMADPELNKLAENRTARQVLELLK